MNTILKFLCLQNDPNKYSRSHYFTIGKIYDCHIISGNHYIKNDNGQQKHFSEWMFNTDRFKMVNVEKYRNEQLEKVLDIEPFAPKKSILERYGTKQGKRDIKIDKLLEL